MEAIGVDIGGTGIKAALVDTETGALLTPREKVATPKPATPEAVTAAVGALVAPFPHTTPLGIGFPASMVDGIALVATHMGPEWVGTHVAEVFAEGLGRPVTVLNDADAAGIAEMRFGVGRDEPGVVMLLTLGTGIGSALFLDGKLLPNTEFGHLEMDGVDAELRAAPSVRDSEHLSWQRWARRLDAYLAMVERLFSPRLIILGGGVSRRPERFMPFLARRTRVVPAALQNGAGVVGAAVATRMGASPGGVDSLTA